MENIIEVLGYIVVGIIVVSRLIFGKKKSSGKEFGLTEEGKLNLPFIDQPIEGTEIEELEVEDILSPQDSVTLKEAQQYIDTAPGAEQGQAAITAPSSVDADSIRVAFTSNNIRQAIILTEILKPPKSLR
ncbi:MAG: hypothetical protein QGI86_19755 [Candidatus Poribacteria bacterium]|jgi:hypothetical protein|nr:hypothetical protein [Candidatus Poribacteria bacterium]MDP6748455.1 hypothetical protein [Candidatus Poribacteria bacterium]MDP6960329.1 hypothetical protein [Dehalococcoidia bacterium]